MPCYNRLEKERLSGANGNGNGNGAVYHTANGHVAQPTAVMSAEKAADKAYSLQMLEEIWVNAEHSKDVSFDISIILLPAFTVNEPDEYILPVIKSSSSKVSPNIVLPLSNKVAD